MARWPGAWLAQYQTLLCERMYLMQKMMLWSIGSIALLFMLVSPSPADDLADMQAQMDMLRNRIDQQEKIINITNILGFKAFGLPMKTYFDFIHNCGDEDRSMGYSGQDNGFAFGLKVGKNKKKGDWSAGYKYAYIEANATPGAFNDSDFGHANRKGHTLGAKYNLTDSLTIGGKLLYTEPITGSSENQRDTTVQLDLVWKF